MNLIDELDLCDDEHILSKKDKLPKIGKLLGLNTKVTMIYPIKVGI